jgi:hypothetical protein
MGGPLLSDALDANHNHLECYLPGFGSRERQLSPESKKTGLRFHCHRDMAAMRYMWHLPKRIDCFGNITIS